MISPSPHGSLEPGSRARDPRIDTLRALACILLVSYHVIGATLDDGLQIAHGALRTGEDLLASLRTPLFTFLSGYVYARSPVGDTPVAAFLRDKARRLLVPMLVVGTTFALVHELLPGSRGWQVEWRWLHLLPVGHYWFVEALFVIFIAVLALERAGLLATPRRWLLCWGGAALCYLVPHPIPWLGIGGAITLLPFFLLGLYCRRFGGPEAWRPLTGLGQKTWTLLLIALLAALFAAAHLGGVEGTVDTPVTLLIGTAACVLLLATGLSSRLLASIGAYSYTIYLFHVFFTAGSRIALTRAGVDDIGVLYVSGLAAGLLLPIGVDRVLARWRPTRVLVLGRR